MTAQQASRIPALRLAAQHLSRPHAGTPAAVVERMVAVQAQDFTGAKWALGTRLHAATDADVMAAFNAGHILRTHVLRPTWHFVAPADIRALLRLTAPRIIRQNEAMGRRMGFTSALLVRSNDVIGKALSGERHLTRDQLRSALEASGIDTVGEQRMTYFMMHAELSGIVCSGPRLGNQFSYALLDERVPTRWDPGLARDAFLASLLERYLATRGPATDRDFAWWAGLTLADARAGFATAGRRARKIAEGDATFWTMGSSRAASTGGPRARLLSIYDEYISSYRSRDVLVSPAYAARLVGKGNALAWVLLLDGRIAGTWRRVVDRASIRVELEPFRRLVGAERKAIREEAARYAAFLGMTVDLDERGVSR